MPPPPKERWLWHQKLRDEHDRREPEVVGATPPGVSRVELQDGGILVTNDPARGARAPPAGQPPEPARR